MRKKEKRRRSGQGVFQRLAAVACAPQRICGRYK